MPKVVWDYRSSGAKKAKRELTRLEKDTQDLNKAIGGLGKVGLPIAADAFLTFACEAALETEAPRSALMGLLTELLGTSGAS